MYKAVIEIALFLGHRPMLSELNALKELAIMGYENESSGVTGKCLLQLLDGFHIEVIGGLVKYQHVGWPRLHDR